MALWQRFNERQDAGMRFASARELARFARWCGQVTDLREGGTHLLLEENAKAFVEDVLGEGSRAEARERLREHTDNDALCGDFEGALEAREMLEELERAEGGEG